MRAYAHVCCRCTHPVNPYPGPCLVEHVAVVCSSSPSRLDCSDCYKLEYCQHMRSTIVFSAAGVPILSTIILGRRFFIYIIYLFVGVLTAVSGIPTLCRLLRTVITANTCVCVCCRCADPVHPHPRAYCLEHMAAVEDGGLCSITVAASTDTHTWHGRC
jgi:hypothetical protein